VAHKSVALIAFSIFSTVSAQGIQCQGQVSFYGNAVLKPASKPLKMLNPLASIPDDGGPAYYRVTTNREMKICRIEKIYYSKISLYWEYKYGLDGKVIDYIRGPNPIKSQR
jgi:hypothetical protein